MSSVLIDLYHDMHGNARFNRGENGKAGPGGRNDSGKGDVESGEAAPLIGSRRAAETETMNRVLERGEGGRRRSDRGNSSKDEEEDHGDESWIDELEDKGVVDGCGYCCEQMRTNPKFLRGLIKYM